MAEFMNVQQQKRYPAWGQIDRCKELLRFKSENVDFLALEFLHDTGVLTPRKQMEIFLRFVADPGFLFGISEDFGIPRSAACQTVSYVMDKITDRAKRWIHFPSTNEEINEAIQLWQSKFCLPTVIGALDCTHVHIKKPAIHGDEYVNRKGNITINVQSTCDALGRFTSVSAEWPGSVHDARIWQSSPIRKIMSHFDSKACLLGDSEYGISPSLITPFKPPTNEAERKFNLQHSSERYIIERSFSILKKRFPVLSNCDLVPTEDVPKVVVCCAVLHNVGLYLGDVYDENFDFEEIGIEEVQWESDTTMLRGQQKRREMLMFMNY